MPERTYRYRLYPTQKQQMDIMRTCSAGRFLYNQLLEDRTEHYRETGKWKRLDASAYKDLPFLSKTDPMALVWAQNSLEAAYRSFFHVLHTQLDRYRPECLEKAQTDPTYKLMDTDLMGYPRFKRKKPTGESYTTYLQDITIENNRILLPCVGWVKIRLHRPIPEEAEQICTTVLKKPAGDYYLLFRLKFPDVPQKEELEKSIGVVFVPGELAVRSDNASIPFRHQQEDLTQKINRAYKTLKRRMPGSRRYEKARTKLAGLYAHRGNQRMNDLHKAARQIVDAGDIFYLQQPDVKERLPALSGKERMRQLDEAWRLFWGLMKYKAQDAGKRFWSVPMAYPAASYCSVCGSKEAAVKGNVRCCASCGAEIDRHLNAACNLRELGYKYIREKRQED